MAKKLLGRVIGDVYPVHSTDRAYQKMDEIHLSHRWYVLLKDAPIGILLTNTEYWTVTWVNAEEYRTFPSHSMDRTYRQYDEIHTDRVWYKALADMPAGTLLTDTAFWQVTWTNPNVFDTHPSYDPSRTYAIYDEIHTPDVWYRSNRQIELGEGIDSDGWDVIWTNPNAFEVYPNHDPSITYNILDEVHAPSGWYRAKKAVPVDTPLSDTSFWTKFWTNVESFRIYPGFSASTQYRKYDEIHTAQHWYRAKVDAINVNLDDLDTWDVIWTAPASMSIYPNVDTTRTFRAGDEIHATDNWYKAKKDVPIGIPIDDGIYWDIIWVNGAAISIYHAFDSTIAYHKGDEIHRADKWFKASADIPRYSHIGDSRWEVIWTDPHNFTIYPDHDDTIEYVGGDEIHQSDKWHKALQAVPAGIALTNRSYWTITWTNPDSGGMTGAEILQAIKDMGATDATKFLNAVGEFAVPAGGSSNGGSSSGPQVAVWTHRASLTDVTIPAGGSHRIEIALFGTQSGMALADVDWNTIAASATLINMHGDSSGNYDEFNTADLALSTPTLSARDFGAFWTCDIHFHIINTSSSSTKSINSVDGGTHSFNMCLTQYA